MPDHDATPDPVDKAYVQAEAMLDDEAARAARRARVLVAVSRETQAEPAVSAPSKQRGAWGRGGWLAAASVAGLTAVVALRLYPPVVTRDEPSRARPPVEAAPAPAVAATPAPGASERAPAPTPTPAAPTIALPPQTRSASDMLEARVSPPLTPPVQTAPAPALAAPPPPSSGSDEAAVASSRAAPPPPSAQARSGPAAAPAAMQATARASKAGDAARLQAAAAAGRLGELTALLVDGAPVDARDEHGETALMKAVQARRPAAAALLRQRGAELDLRNSAGVSVRDMAASIDDPELSRALGLIP